MPKYRVSFFKRLLSSDGHPFKCLQEHIVLSDMESPAEAAECASQLFAVHHSIREWKLYADELEVTVANNGS
jgi:hypothetical protein